ncbi:MULTISPECIES: XRE family transcriptional regulator [unclassified Caballeronia]|uniref:helix-turn-helix domain-containing protein n=1 Tax=unclassified Caballeronia TaxID=2646786 RepID=UPI00202990CB|nr:MULTISPECIES: XRE family transcriptional regulator [unclassified Caballeronia]
MTPGFDAANLRLVRCAQGLSLSDVGDAVNKSKQFIQRIESGMANPTDELVDALAAALRVHREFFYPGAPQALSEEAFHFRGLLGARAADKATVIAKGEIFRRFVAVIDAKLKLPRLDFPEFPIDSPEAAERAAERCRVHWGLGLGPIGNMVRVLENAGAVVTAFENTAREIDALSIASSRPIVVSSRTDTSACRVRFGHAHELGHFVGHVGKKTGDKATEAEANRFAGAFLMPRSSFVKEFPALRGGTQINWIALSELKFRWRVSKAAMLYRARQLGIVSEQLYKRALIGHLYAKSERHTEVEDASIPHEKPELLANALELLREKLGCTVSEIAAISRISPELLMEVAPLAVHAHRSAEGVVSLAQFRSSRAEAAT